MLDILGIKQPIEIPDEVLVAAMRAFEPLSSVLRYREKDKWHTCDIMAMREAIKAALITIRQHHNQQHRKG